MQKGTDNLASHLFSPAFLSFFTVSLISPFLLSILTTAFLSFSSLSRILFVSLPKCLLSFLPHSVDLSLSPPSLSTSLQGQKKVQRCLPSPRLVLFQAAQCSVKRQSKCQTQRAHLFLSVKERRRGTRNGLTFSSPRRFSSTLTRTHPHTHTRTQSHPPKQPHTYTQTTTHTPTKNNDTTFTAPGNTAQKLPRLSLVSPSPRLTIIASPPQRRHLPSPLALSSASRRSSCPHSASASPRVTRAPLSAPSPSNPCRHSLPLTLAAWATAPASRNWYARPARPRPHLPPLSSPFSLLGPLFGATTLLRPRASRPLRCSASTRASRWARARYAAALAHSLPLSRLCFSHTAMLPQVAAQCAHAAVGAYKQVAQLSPEVRLLPSPAPAVWIFDASPRQSS